MGLGGWGQVLPFALLANYEFIGEGAKGKT